MDLGIRRQSRTGFDETLARIPEALKSEGFGVLTEIDVTDTLKKKLGVDFRRYRILGACNPPLALRALEANPGIGTMLPCNVAVYETDDGGAMVIAVDPLQTLASADPALRPIAETVREKLVRALDRIG